MHYGFINAESQPGEGTTITVRLPIVKELLEEEEQSEIQLPTEKEVKIDNYLFEKDKLSKVEASGEFSDSLVFYAEDNPEMRNFVSEILSGFFKVKSFRNGQECFDAFEEEWPDILISDVQMPEMNGLDLCLKIKSDLKTSHIPVILLTAKNTVESQIEGYETGADGYLNKPFNIDVLRASIQSILKNRESLRQKFQKEIDSRKSEKGKSAQVTKRDEILKFFSRKNKQNLKLMFDLQKEILRINILMFELQIWRIRKLV